MHKTIMIIQIYNCLGVNVTTTDIYKQGFTNVSTLKILYVPYANVTTKEGNVFYIGECIITFIFLFQQRKYL